MRRRVLVCLAWMALFEAPGQEAKPVGACASGRSSATVCAEEDNIYVPFRGPVSSFTIEATQPAYPVGTDNCDADFTGCPPPESGYSFTAGVFKLYDDGVTVVEAVREASWWRPNGMSAAVDMGPPVSDAHYIVLYRKVADANEWPQSLVLYMDGNLRLIPHPPLGSSSVCFGSSVIVGPVAAGTRPIAEISSVLYRSDTQTLEVQYRVGASARIKVEEVTRLKARLTVILNDRPTLAFAAFRSMFVSEGNADVDEVAWRDDAGAMQGSPIMDFRGGESAEWFFHRRARSRHNTSAPDIRIRAADFFSPGITSAGIVNAASLLAGPVVPGEIVAIFGSGIGPCEGALLRLNQAGLVDNLLADTVVRFGGTSAPLTYVGEDQVNTVVPYTVAGQSTADVEVEYRGRKSNRVTLPVAPAVPGVFTLDASGRGPGAVLNEDYAVNSKATPVEEGKYVIIFATGEGQTSPLGVDGKPAATPLPKPLLPVRLLIGNAEAVVDYAGGAPGLVAGVLQVNARVPLGSPSGDAVPVVILVNDIPSQPGVTIAVR